MRILKRNRIIATNGIALMILLITAGCGSNKNAEKPQLTRGFIMNRKSP